MGQGNWVAGKMETVLEQQFLKISLNKIKKTEIMLSIFSNQSSMKLKSVTGRKLQKSQVCGNPTT